MILGVYWYFGFPEGLYSYEYFTFQKGLGGHADAPAELLADIKVKDVNMLIAELKTLADQYTDALIFVYKSGNELQVSIGGYSMHDYEFELAKKIDMILKEKDAQKIKIKNVSSFELMRLGNQQSDVARFNKKYFSIVGSNLRKSNAETSSIRFDCNLEESEKDVFFNDLKVLTQQSGIDVVYYLEKKYENRINLMLFFTNGRQGVGLISKKRIDIVLFESGMDVLINAHDIHTGHVGGWDYYPKGMPVALKIVDAEFIL